MRGSKSLEWLFVLLILAAIPAGHYIGYHGIAGISSNTYYVWTRIVGGLALLGFLSDLATKAKQAWLSIRNAATLGARAEALLEVLLDVIFGFLKAIVSSIATIGFGFSGWAAVKIISAWALNPETGRLPAMVFCVPMTIFAGVGLFTIRKYARIFYGCTEVAVGILVALQQVVSVEPHGSVLSQRVLLGLLTAGVYLIVRGLDNIDVGRKAEQPDFVISCLRSRAWFPLLKKKT